MRRVADIGADRMSYQNQIEQAYRTRQLADAKRAAKLGLNTFEDLKEVRVVGDEERAIVDALNALRHRCTYERGAPAHDAHPQGRILNKVSRGAGFRKL